MPTNPPLYDVNDTVYFKESAALGHLEAVTISGVLARGNTWLYTIHASRGQPTAVAHYGDRKTMTQGAVLYFSEDELILLCDALDLAEANAQAQLDRIQAQRAAMCSDDEPTAGT
jgi:hypothetical protein